MVIRGTSLATSTSAMKRTGSFPAFITVAILHVAGWGLLIVSADWSESAGAITIGTGVLAYMLGLRHAFDADHIAAIDNATRKLMSSGERAGSVGLFFSLGHSTVVFTVSALIALGLSSLGVALADDHSALRVIGGNIGSLIAGIFLVLIAVLNAFVLLSLIKTAQRLRAGITHHELEKHMDSTLESRGLLNRLFKPVSKVVDRPWKLYPLGILFGLGLDTASSIAMLAVAGGAALSGGNILAVLALPLLFTSGMALGDTVDGFMMIRAYGWAAGHTDRRLYYNIAITSASIIAAGLIGLPILLSLCARTFSLSGGFWDFTASLEFDYLGFVLLGVFLIMWTVGWLVWKAKPVLVNNSETP